MKLILPVAGKSTRFAPVNRPKWLITHPNGNLMLTESIINLNYDFEEIIIVHKQEDEEKFNFKTGLQKNLSKYIDTSIVSFVSIDYQTKNQIQTVVEGIKSCENDFGFLIKDSDNKFSIDNFEANDNVVFHSRLDMLDYTNPSNKSYINKDKFNYVTSIVEKKVISNFFCCGGYYFKSSKSFMEYFDEKDDNAYISDIIFKMMLDNVKFKTNEVLDYCDWGTIKDWRDYTENFKTMFIDLDGTLFYNSSEYFPPYIEDAKPIIKNIDRIKELANKGSCEIIITTSRNEKYRKITELQLEKEGIKYKDLIMGLQHNKRYLINDFSSTNSYPTAVSINLKRNSDNLNDLI